MSKYISWYRKTKIAINKLQNFIGYSKILGTLQLPEKSSISRSQSSSSILNSSSSKQLPDSPPSPLPTPTPPANIETSTDLLSEELGTLQTEQATDQANDGWLNWAMSYVPAILVEDDEDIINTQGNESTVPVQIEMNTGFYFDEFNISFKVY